MKTSFERTLSLTSMLTSPSLNLPTLMLPSFMLRIYAIY